MAFIEGTLGFIPEPALGIAACPLGVERLTTACAALCVGAPVMYALGSGLTLAVTTYLTYVDGDEDIS